MNLYYLLIALQMGQILVNDKSGTMMLQPPPCNVTQKKVFTPMLICKSIEVPFYEKVFQYQNYKKIQVTFKFFSEIFVHLQLVKQKSKEEQGCPFIMGNDLVYGYKFKKNEKSEKIRPDKIFFKRKIYSGDERAVESRLNHRQRLLNGIKSRSKGRDDENNRRRESRYKGRAKEETVRRSGMEHKQDLLRKLAEIKLMSKMEIGAKLARIIDGSDGVITDNYVEFYSEVPIEKGEFEKRELAQKEKLCAILKRKGFKVNAEAVEMAYSVFQKGYILKQSKKAPKEQDLKESRSIKYMVKACEQQINFLVCKLDGITNMMSAIQNHLSYRDTDKAMQKFEEIMANMDEAERLAYAQQMQQILGKYSFYRPYEREVSSYISSSRSSIYQSRNLSSSKFGEIRARSPESSSDSYQSISTFRSSKNSPEYDSRAPISPVTTSPKTNLPIRFSDCDSPHVTVTSDKDYSTSEFSYKDLSSKQSNYMMWEGALQRLKNSIIDNDKQGIGGSLTCLRNLGVLSPLQIEEQYGRMLMENAKTKYAKMIFERVLYSKKNSRDAFLCSQIETMLAFLCHSKGEHASAFQHYQKALTQRFKFRNYSRKTAIIFNNMSVIQYCLERYDKSLLYLHRGFRLGEYCPDYELVMRNNYAMILAEQGQLKQAKMQMYKTYRNVQPYSNMQILCKFHNNLGYFEMLEKVYDKAKINFDSACEIEAKFLVPNGYKPSVFLHNNLAIYYTKTPSRHNVIDWKKAAFELYKIENQLSEIQGILSVQIHFNFGKILKQDYKRLDEAENHFFQSRNKLLKLKEVYIMMYLEKINAEIDKIQTQRIQQEPQESCYTNKLSKVSGMSRLSNKQLQSKILN